MNKIRILLSLLFVCCEIAYAGNQQYEDLKAETRQLMSQSVADQLPKNSSFSSPEVEKQWLIKNSPKISKFIADENDRQLILRAVHYESIRAGLDPALILGLIQVESGFKKYAVSSVGARGYMQVMPFWVDTIGTVNHNLFHLRTNLRYGCTILRHYLDIEKGNMFRALGRYNGSLGKSEYPNAVFASAIKFKDN